MKSSDAGRPEGSGPGREIQAAVIVLAAALALGFVIQMLLQLREVTREERNAEAIMGSVLSAIHERNAEDTARRTAAAERMTDLPEEKRARLDDLHLELLTILSSLETMHI